VRIAIKVIPNGGQTAFVEFKDNIIKIRIQAPPDKGKANKALIDFLAKRWGVPKSAIAIVSGATSRLKHIEILTSSSLDQLVAVLQEQ
jgi:hypothetical protein